MNKTGKMVIPYAYQTVGDFSDGRIVVSKNDKYGVIDRTGKTIVPFKFSWLDDYYEGLARYNTLSIAQINWCP
ncbi:MULTISPECIES: WG repeat-containing protein [unclassified Psychrobacter]|uniref:WG repeat-containing protein n=2 Tax=Psychrobacter TaxID=497 RepID=UPI000760D2FB|nr:WG repeat-containing protein [Psychrobacter sp. P11F6]